MPDANEILVQMKLELDGILRVEATEKCTGLARRITITDAARRMSREEITRSSGELASLYESLDDGAGGDEGTSDEPAGGATVVDLSQARRRREAGADAESMADKGGELVDRSRGLFSKMHPDDRMEAVELNDRILSAIEQGDDGDLEEMLFFVEGKQGGADRGARSARPPCAARQSAPAAVRIWPPCLRLVVRAWSARRRGREALLRGRFDRVLTLAARAQEMHATKAGRRLELLAGWLVRQSSSEAGPD